VAFLVISYIYIYKYLNEYAYSGKDKIFHFKCSLQEYCYYQVNDSMPQPTYVIIMTADAGVDSMLLCDVWDVIIYYSGNGPTKCNHCMANFDDVCLPHHYDVYLPHLDNVDSSVSIRESFVVHLNQHYQGRADKGYIHGLLPWQQISTPNASFNNIRSTSVSIVTITYGRLGQTVIDLIVAIFLQGALELKSMSLPKYVYLCMIAIIDTLLSLTRTFNGIGK